MSLLARGGGSILQGKLGETKDTRDLSCATCDYSLTTMQFIANCLELWTLNRAVCSLSHLSNQRGSITPTHDIVTTLASALSFT
jgi:hypothetical protein